MTVAQLARKNLIARTIATLLMIGFLFFLAQNYWQGLSALFAPPAAVDLARAAGEKPLVALTGEEPYGDQLLRAYRALLHTDKTPDHPTWEQSHRYEQDGRYLFALTVERVFPQGGDFDGILWGMPNGGEAVAYCRYILCETDGVRFLARVGPKAALSPGDRLAGVFSPFPDAALRQMNDLLDEPTELFAYQFDSLWDPVGENLGALVLVLLWLIFTVWLTVTWVRQLVRRERRPVYKSIRLLGGDEAEIDRQLREAKYMDKRYITKDWVVLPGLFWTKLTRNIAGVKAPTLRPPRRPVE